MREIPKGYHVVLVVDTRWTADPDVVCSYTCRQPKCGKRAVAALYRTHRYRYDGERKVPWRYCEDHLYGRVIEDGVVKYERLEKDKD